MASPEVLETERSASLRDVTDLPLWTAAAALALGIGASVWALGWSVQSRSLFAGFEGVALLGGVGVFYHVTGRSVALARFGFAMALSVALAYTCQLATFILGLTGMPFRSALLTRADAMFGFSWPVWKSWVETHPGLQLTFQLVYPGHLAATGVAVAALSLLTPFGAMRFLRAFAIAFAVSAVGQLLVPAMDNRPDAPSNAVRQALRDRSFVVLDDRMNVGLISLPSMHAVLAVLVLVALWRFRLWRIPLIVFSAITLLGTVSEGGHYLVDVLAGIVVGVAAYWAAGRSLPEPDVSHERAVRVRA